ncbi:hypothetical protein HOY80DRAFT_1059440 [Tuber brumale]|nr:hypothetical protein HOY80DRAFT_1059440 [Tuber brumale]
MADLPTPTKVFKLHSFPIFQSSPPRISETSSSPSTSCSIPFSSSSRPLPPLVLSSSNPISRHPGVLDSTPSQAISGGVLTREHSSSSNQSRESIYSAGPSINAARAKDIFKQHEVPVADIMSDIGQLQIYQSGDASFENLFSRNDIPENATPLQYFRKGVKCGGIKSAPFLLSSPLGLLLTFPLGLGNYIDVREAIPTRPLFTAGLYNMSLQLQRIFIPAKYHSLSVTDALLRYNPHEAVLSYNPFQSTVQEEGSEKFCADVIGQVNKNTVTEAVFGTPTRDSHASISSACRSAGSDGTLGDLSSERILAVRKANAERYGSPDK